MRWGHLTLRFARPIRWLVALYGSEGVPFEVAEVPSARTSRGHRFLSSGPVEVPTADDYLATLQQACVTVDHRRRQEQIAEQARVAAAAEGGRPRIDPALLEEVGFLIEYPTCLCGAFPEEYLALPEPVLVTVMAKHQRYFPVEDESGRLLPRFVAIRNGDDRSLGLVRRGNERVIVPRFADARFYYQEDTQRKLADRLPDLERVSFMERQGSLRDKTDRIAALAEDLIAAAGVGTEDGRTAVEAARLCKCDLVTLMVQDLTSLQGIMGAEYLRQEGSCEPVCMAVEEHYRPRFAGDDLPGTVPGALVSLADKLDNLAACFALDLIPKGTSDPYALRRQAAGVLAILLERRWRIDLWACLGAALARLPHCELEPGAALAALRDFLALRLDAALESAEVAYDLRRAALGALGPDLVDAFDRGLALSRARSADPPGFAQATFAAARVGKIIRPALGQAAAEVRPDGFEKAIENRLWDAFTAARARVEALLKADQRDYLQVWQALASLERPIWDYFDVDTGVMVMAEDPAVRANRLALLRAIDELFLRLADFTEIVVE
jgi:glycyl-tRNA synthetase beta chain